MTRREIEQGFVNAGWELDGGFSDHLLVGEDGGMSILAHRWAWRSDDPVFELWDGERNLTFWVIPTSRQAAVLLAEHDGPPEQERGNLYKANG